MVKYILYIPLLVGFFICLSVKALSQTEIRKSYTKTEVMIPMRDGVRLHTAIYEPTDLSERHPILIKRTPYGIANGDKWTSELWNSWQKYAEANYIIVQQDVRGRFGSEGDFVDIRPLLPTKHGKKEIDEATDTYDTADWLLKNVKSNNGNIGISGNSYAGFYAIQGALSRHPAIKVAVPQAPVLSWWRGDDFHRNGVFFLRDAFSFCNNNCRTRPSWNAPRQASKKYFWTDEYSFFQKQKTIANLTSLFQHEIPFWDDMVSHPDEDEWWLARDYRNRCTNISAAIMVVGGLWDAEDFYGACQLYEAIGKNSPKTNLFLTLGPWKHGGWNSLSANQLGNIVFGEVNQSEYYQECIEFPFVNHYLKDSSTPLPTKVNLFYTGVNQWKHYAQWPVQQTEEYRLYLHSDGLLSEQAPLEAQSFTRYCSDPAHPVPYMDGVLYGRPADYMTADQRFAARRGDVLLFKTAPLTDDMTLCGDIDVTLQVTLSSTDTDFVVKVLDIFPEDYTHSYSKSDPIIFNGYQLPVRMDIFRGRYREGFQEGKAFTPNKITLVPFTMQRIAHTFRKGHRVGIQIQSSWFPLADMNPQQLVNPYTCEAKDFLPCTVSIFHQKQAASCLTFRKIQPAIN